MALDLEPRLGREDPAQIVLIGVIGEPYGQPHCHIVVQKTRRLTNDEHTANQLHLLIGNVRREQFVRGHQRAGHSAIVRGLRGHDKNLACSLNSRSTGGT